MTTQPSLRPAIPAIIPTRPLIHIVWRADSS